MDQHTGSKWLIDGTDTPQGHSVAKHGTGLLNILVENTNLTKAFYEYLNSRSFLQQLLWHY